MQNLIDQGKKPEIIVHSLRSLPFDGATLDEQGPQPPAAALRASFERAGIAYVAGDDDQALDDRAAQRQQLNRDDQALDDFFKECDL